MNYLVTPVQNSITNVCAASSCTKCVTQTCTKCSYSGTCDGFHFGTSR